MFSAYYHDLIFTKISTFMPWLNHPVWYGFPAFTSVFSEFPIQCVLGCEVNRPKAWRTVEE